MRSARRCALILLATLPAPVLLAGAATASSAGGARVTPLTGSCGVQVDLGADPGSADVRVTATTAEPTRPAGRVLGLADDGRWQEDDGAVREFALDLSVAQPGDPQGHRVEVGVVRDGATARELLWLPECVEGDDPASASPSAPPSASPSAAASPTAAPTAAPTAEPTAPATGGTAPPTPVPTGSSPGASASPSATPSATPSASPSATATATTTPPPGAAPVPVTRPGASATPTATTTAGAPGPAGAAAGEATVVVSAAGAWRGTSGAPPLLVGPLSAAAPPGTVLGAGVAGLAPLAAPLVAGAQPGAELGPGLAPELPVEPPASPFGDPLAPQVAPAQPAPVLALSQAAPRRDAVAELLPAALALVLAAGTTAALSRRRSAR